MWDARQAASAQDAQDAELRRVMSSLAAALGCDIPGPPLSTSEPGQDAMSSGAGGCTLSFVISSQCLAYLVGVFSTVCKQEQVILMVACVYRMIADVLMRGLAATHTVSNAIMQSGNISMPADDPDEVGNEVNDLSEPEMVSIVGSSCLIPVLESVLSCASFTDISSR